MKITTSFSAVDGVLIPRRFDHLWIFSLFLLAAVLPRAVEAQTQLVSQRHPAMPVPVVDFQDSVSPSISADGRYVVFVSSANNLVPGDNSQLGTDVYLRDRASNTTTLVSVNMFGTGGGNDNSWGGTISADGRYILFESLASDLVAGDTNGGGDVFMRDLQSNTTLLISVSTNGDFGNKPSSDAVMTPDGRYVVFLSYATNLASGDGAVDQDVFVRDMLTGTTTLVSVGAASLPFGITEDDPTAMASPSISANGRFVAFFSSAANLVAGMTNYPGDIFMRDLLSGTTTWISTNLSTTQIPTNSASFHPEMSSDGRYVVYKYGPKNTATNSGALIFLYDSLTGSNTLILSNAFALGGPYEDDAYGPEISVDGRYVAWVTNIVDGTGTNHSAVRLFDTQTLTDTLASQDQSGGISPNTFSDTPVLSSDGRFISFLSSANDLATNQVAGGGTYLYHRDQQSGTTRLANVDLAGMVPGVPSVSSDGRFIAFATGDMLLNGDTNRACDVFVRDTMTESNELISMRDASVLSQSASGISLAPQYSVSSDGRWIAFTSLAPDLVTNDFNNSQDVFAYDRQKGSNILVSIGNTGYAATGGPSFNPVISPNGRYVAFLSSATDLLVTNMTNFGYFANNLYLRDLQYGTTALVAGNRVPSVPTDSLNPTFSLDNQYLAYVRRTNDNFGSSSANFSVLRYDVSSGTTTNFPGNVSPAIAPSMSADGRFTAFALVGVSAVVWDSQDLILYSSFFRPSSVLSLALSPTGTRLAMQNTTSVYVVDFRANAASNTFLYSASAGVPPIRNGPVWSADGRYFVFAGAVSAFPWSNNVFLYDIQTKSTNLVSVNSNHTGGANGICDWPVISGDGRFILFSSNAKNIVPLPNTNEANLYVFDRVTGSNSLLAVIPPSTSWNEWRAKPAINGDGRVIVFQSPGSMSTGGLDLNRSQDIFAISRAPWGATDSDTDGIPDAWMIYYFGHATGQGGDQSLALDDADGDGMVNLQEYLAGTDPRIAASVLRLGISSVPSGNGLLLTWPAVPGKSYKVQYKNSLTDASWTDVSEPITFGGLTASYRATPSQSARYYRAVASD